MKLFETYPSKSPKEKKNLNVCLVLTLLSNFDIDPAFFFCLALVPVICKTFDFSSPLKFQFKKKNQN